MFSHDKWFLLLGSKLQNILIRSESFDGTSSQLICKSGMFYDDGEAGERFLQFQKNIPESMKRLSKKLKSFNR
jgi:hypothetical protein